MVLKSVAQFRTEIVAELRRLETHYTGRAILAERKRRKAENIQFAEAYRFAADVLEKWPLEQGK